MISETLYSFRQRYPFRPDQIVWNCEERPMEVMSYPFVDESTMVVKVMVRTIPGDPMTLVAMPVIYLRKDPPTQFGVYFPWNNLGCFGFKIFWLYFDFYRGFNHSLWLYINFRGRFRLGAYRVRLFPTWTIIPDRRNEEM